jgi:hypothetical protein
MGERKETNKGTKGDVRKRDRELFYRKGNSAGKNE